ncbi:hypothetical protein PR003_g578 [Phytophthora rubi]|uniref:Uncharacterized protein n=1 Tax=Phytophthora rubi TaxID=129364 RepID=A0A6A4G590_9STRA|nr:hypothetical protein PR002_g1256 [Phytophthora rubi]KAE9359751.1 hypothetical protein PR003_g578 [Phytophthora rubi]
MKSHYQTCSVFTLLCKADRYRYKLQNRMVVIRPLTQGNSKLQE